MRIISSFHDFYDSVMRMGMDKDVIYVRDLEEILIKDDFEVSTRSGNYGSGYNVDTMYLGFCGQIYRIFIVKHKEWNYEQIYYNYEDFKADTLRVGATSKHEFVSRWWKGAYEKFMEEDATPLLEFFHKYQVPIFLVTTSEERNKQKLILNPNLKRLNFQKIKDTYTTYQDIFQYVAGTLNRPENDMIEILDRDKISKHGFDRFSFRKLPTKKKKR